MEKKLQSKNEKIISVNDLVAKDEITTKDRIVISVDELIKKSSVSVKEQTDHMRAKAAVAIAAAAVFIGVTFLGVALYIKDAELKAWATSLISLVVGAAIGFIFSGSNSTTT